MENFKKRLLKLRDLMKDFSIDTYIITKTDYHQSEYVDEHFNYVKFISGFSGSYASVVVTKKEAFLFTDGRYYIQAKKELKNTDIKIYEKSDINFLTFSINKTKKNETIGFNGKTLSVKESNFLINKCNNLNINVNYNIDLLDKLWKNRPKIQESILFNLDIKYSGKSTKEKIQDIKTKMNKYNCDFYIISSLDDIAWLFNIRAINNYSSFNFYAYCIITNKETVLFINYKKDDITIENLKSDNIVIKKYDELLDYIKNINKLNINQILLNPSKTSYYLYRKISSICNKNIVEIFYDITSLLKSRKNNVEVKNIKTANIKYALVIFRLIKWLKENIEKTNITEFDIEKKLDSLRKKDKNYLCPSFKTISAYEENSAIVHYNTKKNGKKLKNKGVLLLDSGANYLEGTTDITRTILLGKIPKETKKYYTLVLKGLISLSKAKFLYGSTGSNLDILARISLWNCGYNYNHGTGHGIGFCLNVHEGPQRISMESNNTVLEENMILSNEPGIYIENKFGIRLENTIIVKKSTITNFGKFMKFETLSFIPFELDAIEISLLNREEKDWLNNYNKNIYKKLEPYITNEEKVYLKNMTRKI